MVKDITREDPSIYLANSMNPLRLEGQKSISIEICQQFGWQPPDVVIIPGGNLGNVSALGAGFDMLFELGMIDKRPRIVVAQTEKANPLYQAYLRGFDNLDPVRAEKTLASAIQIGNPVSYPRAVRVLKRYNGMVYQVSEQQLSDAAHRADRTGLYSCPHTGVALGALEQMVEDKQLSKNDTVVVVSTAHGLKFSEFKTGYHQNELDSITSNYANPVEKSLPETDSVSEILDRRLAKEKKDG